MLKSRMVGRNAGALKYDLLTAMGAYALVQSKGQERLIFRLMTLVTARYNWSRDELAVGQREIARLWSVDERTVKREMAKLRAMAWLVQKRAGARGRVAEYGLGIDQILQDTRLRWQDVGPDFDHRLAGTQPHDNVVALPSRGNVAPPPLDARTEWGLAQIRLHREDPGLYAAWFAKLEQVGRAGSRIRLKAPSRFCASYVMTHLNGMLLRALGDVDATVTDIVVES